MYLKGGAYAAKVLEIHCDEESDPVGAVGGSRNGGTAVFVRDCGGADGGALTSDCGVHRYLQTLSSGGALPRNSSCGAHRRA